MFGDPAAATTGISQRAATAGDKGEAGEALRPEWRLSAPSSGRHGRSWRIEINTYKSH